MGLGSLSIARDEKAPGGGSSKSPEALSAAVATARRKPSTEEGNGGRGKRV